MVMMTKLRLNIILTCFIILKQRVNSFAAYNNSQQSNSNDSSKYNSHKDQLVTREASNESIIRTTNSNEEVLAEVAPPIQTLPGQDHLFNLMRRPTNYFWRPFFRSETRVKTALARRRTQPGARDTQTLTQQQPFDNANQNFRSSSPLNSPEAYALSVKRNSRKRNKPSLWRYALRTYNSMSKKGFVPETEHHEAALVACVKLGDVDEAFRIFEENVLQSSSTKVVTEAMIVSLIRVCCRRARKLPSSNYNSLEAKFLLLQKAEGILLDSQSKYNIPMVSYMVNPLSAAYQSIDLHYEALSLLNLLGERRGGMENEKTLNINDLFLTKDCASYNLIVKSSVSEGNWSAAIDALRGMTEIDVYPESRHVNLWSEIIAKKQRKFKPEYYCKAF